jgi:hypothetical protein
MRYERLWWSSLAGELGLARALQELAYLSAGLRVLGAYGTRLYR